MNKEYEKFSSIADHWWDESGKFSILHTINPLRIKYIINQITKIKKIKRERGLYLNKLDIIDVGCGGGLVCEPLARIGAKVTGIDFIKKNIKIAKKHSQNENLNIKYFVSDINNLQLNKKYDVILILEVIEHIDDWKIILNDLTKNLKPQGIMIISTINRNLLSFMSAIFIAEQILRWIPKGTHEYNKLVKTKELISALEKNNLKIIDFSGLIYNPFKREWSVKKNKTKINYFCTAQKIN